MSDNLESDEVYKSVQDLKAFYTTKNPRLCQKQ